MNIKNRIINSKKTITSTLCNHVLYYSTPSNINYNWSFGSLVGILFALQMLTGIFLAMHYTAHIDWAFSSVEQNFSVGYLMELDKFCLSLFAKLEVIPAAEAAGLVADVVGIPGNGGGGANNGGNNGGNNIIVIIIFSVVLLGGLIYKYTFSKKSPKPPGETSGVAKDPLEQFDVMSIVDSLGITNLSIILFFCLFLAGSFLWSFQYKKFTNYDFILKSIYRLVKNILKENLYIKKQQYFSVLFYLFLVILLSNMVGLIPYSFTVTSAFVVTFFLALTHFIGINLIGISQKRWEFQGLFLPGGSPLPITPFLVFIELVSYIARVFSLSIRLFANMMSGHALLKILIGFSWTLLTSKSMFIIIAIFPWLIVTIIMFLELLIAFLQAYVFVILVTIYINDVLNLH